jgi:hypothetical protein
LTFIFAYKFTPPALIERTLKQDPYKKIVCLERGGACSTGPLVSNLMLDPRLWLPDHFQTLPLPFKDTLGGPSEAFPFTLSRETYKSDVKFVHGSTPFFRGRSTFWSAWSPSPAPELMRNWPKSLVETSKDLEFFARATELLRVTGANDIGAPYANLQVEIGKRLKDGLHNITAADEAYPAPLAVSSMAKTTTVHFNKFSAPGPLLALYKKQQKLAEAAKGSALLFATDTAVEYLMTSIGFSAPPHFDDKEKSVIGARSSRYTGLPVISPDPTKIIPCAGVFSNTTLVLNSFPEIASLQEGIRGPTATAIRIHFARVNCPASAL